MRLTSMIFSWKSWQCKIKAPDTSDHSLMCTNRAIKMRNHSWEWYIRLLKTDEVKWKLLSHVWLFATPWTIQSMEFSRPEYWSGQRSLIQGIFPTHGSNPGLLHCRQILYQLSHEGSPDEVPCFSSDLSPYAPEFGEKCGSLPLFPSYALFCSVTLITQGFIT